MTLADIAARLAAELTDIGAAYDDIEQTLTGWVTDGWINAFDLDDCGCESAWSGYCGGQHVIAINVGDVWAVIEGNRGEFSVSELNATPEQLTTPM